MSECICDLGVCSAAKLQPKSVEPRLTRMARISSPMREIREIRGQNSADHRRAHLNKSQIS
jgi:hypothetical protein